MKMRQNIYFLVSGLVGVLLTSCYQDINLDEYKGQKGEHLLTINSIVNPDSTIKVAATKTYFFSDTHISKDYVTDLDISLTINGINKGYLSFDTSSQMYVSDIKPKESDIIEFTTEYLDKRVECKDTVPDKVKIESIKVTRQGPMFVYTKADYIFTYQIKFSDPVDEDNYYFLQYDEDFKPGDYGNMSIGVRDFSYEFVFQQLARHINAIVPGWEPYSSTGLPFSDYGIDGETHTLIVKEIVQGLDLSHHHQMRRRFHLFSISESYYNYLLSRLYNDSFDSGLHGGMIDMGMTEPIKYYSNIVGGVGIFAAYSLDEVIMEILDVDGPFPEQ